MAKDAVGRLGVERSVGGGAHGDAVANRVEGISGLDVAGKIACQNYFVVSSEADFRVRDKRQRHRNRQTHALPPRHRKQGVAGVCVGKFPRLGGKYDIIHAMKDER